MATFVIYATDLPAAVIQADEVRALGHRAMVRDARKFEGAKDRERCDIVVITGGEFPLIEEAYEGRVQRIMRDDDLAEEGQDGEEGEEEDGDEKDEDGGGAAGDAAAGGKARKPKAAGARKQREAGARKERAAPEPA